MQLDQDLWSKFKGGDKAAYAAIYKAYANGLLSYGKRFTNDQGVIEDCLHDLFVYLWKNRNSISNTDSISRYLLGSFRNNLLNTLKRQAKTKLSNEDINDNFNIELSKESSLIRNEDTIENKKIVESAMNGLSKRQREAIYLKFYKRLANAEIGEIMGLNDQSIRNLISGAIKRMKVQLKNTT